MEQQRLQSLDALRGFDMLFIMGGSSFFVALSKFLPASIGEAIARQMEHTAWSGFTFYDMIFPLFLFKNVIILFFRYIKSFYEIKSGIFSIPFCYFLVC